MHRKKKPNTKQAQKHLAAQYRLDFFHKMKLIIDDVCGNHIFPLIPAFILNDAYLNRSAPFTYQADPHSHIPPGILKDAKVILTHLIKHETLLIPPHNLEISLYDYFTVVYTIKILNARITDTTFDMAGIVKNALVFFKNDTATLETALTKMYHTLSFYNLGECDLRRILYWYRHEVVVPDNAPAETKNIITIFSLKPEHIRVKVDRWVRPALRAGWTFGYTGAYWLSLKPSLLGFKSPVDDIPLKVYIQSHALNRLSERIDCFFTGLVQMSIYISLQNPRFTTDSNNNLLVEYRFLETKAGYFRVDMVNDIILIRTFLFITNNGTPEGELLDKNTGLQKLDKKYLNIDKLSTFMNSDLDKNEEVQKIFKNSGCQCLIDLYNTTKSILTKKDHPFHFDVMLSYINPDKTNT